MYYEVIANEIINKWLDNAIEETKPIEVFVATDHTSELTEE